MNTQGRTVICVNEKQVPNISGAAVTAREEQLDENSSKRELIEPVEERKSLPI